VKTRQARDQGAVSTEVVDPMGLEGATTEVDDDSAPEEWVRAARILAIGAVRHARAMAAEELGARSRPHSRDARIEASETRGRQAAKAKAKGRARTGKAPAGRGSAAS
jgi:hypothetical protein